MTSKPRIIQLLDRILHILMPKELHNPRAVLERVSEADIPGLAHVVFQVLPGSRGGQAGDEHAVLRAASGGPAARPACAEALGAAATGTPASATTTPRELHAEPVAVVVVAVACPDGVFRVSVRKRIR